MRPIRSRRSSATRLLSPAAAVAFAAFFNFAAYFLALRWPAAAQGRRHHRQGPDRQGPDHAGGRVRGAGRGDVLECRDMAQGHSVLVEPCAGRWPDRRRSRPRRHRRDPVDRAQQDPHRDRPVADARHDPDDGHHARHKLALGPRQRARAPSGRFARCTSFRPAPTRSATASTMPKRRWA